MTIEEGAAASRKADAAVVAHARACEECQRTGMKCAEMNRLVEEACALGIYQRAWEATWPTDPEADNLSHQLELAAIFLARVRTDIDNDRPERAAGAFVGLADAVANVGRLLPTSPR